MSKQTFPRCPHSEHEPELMRTHASDFFEEVLIARARLGAAMKHTRVTRPGRSPVKSRTAGAEAYRERHRNQLAYWLSYFSKAGGEAALEPAGRCLAERTAKARLNGDKQAGHCLCAGCGTARGRGAA